MSGGRIGYLVGRYPQMTHTFVLREVQALRRLGLDVDTFSVWRSEPEDLLSGVDREEYDRTETLLPLRPLRTAVAHLRAFVGAPSAYLGALGRALDLRPPGLRGLFLALSWFVEAPILWTLCKRRGIRHLHVHLNGTAPAVANIVVAYANAAEGSENWSYSMTVHGSKEFYDVFREGLERKVTDARFAVCISDYTRSQVMAFVDEEHWERLHVVRCGISPEAFDGGAGNGVVNILTVGRLDRMKGMPILVAAVAELRRRGQRVRLTVVGAGPSQSRLEQEAADAGIADSVDFVGPIGQDRMPDFYAEADIFCLPSFAEGIPIVLMEAMASGVPVVASAITGIPELVEDGVSGFLVRVGRADLLADALAKLVADADLRARMGRTGRRRVERDYTIDRAARELLELFTQNIPGVGCVGAGLAATCGPHADDRTATAGLRERRIHAPSRHRSGGA